MTIGTEVPTDANVSCAASWEPYQTAACALLLVGHAAPAGSAAGLLLLRLCAGAGAAISAWAALCAADRLFWNVAIAAVNGIHAMALLYRLRPVRFSTEVEEVSIFFNNSTLYDFLLYVVASTVFYSLTPTD